jgi:phage gp36-like protein
MSAAYCYATLDDLNGCGLPAPALAGLALDKQQAALVRASRMSDTFLRDRYTLPLHCPIDPALTLWVCWMAAYFLLCTRGFNPNQSGIDTVVRMNYQDALDNLKRVANGQQQLCVKQGAPSSEQPQIGTNESRGYGGPGGLDVPGIGPNTWGQ